MGFILHFYIIFETNLLTGGPAQIVVFFCLFQGFEEKEYQTESKRNETFGNVIFSKNVIKETWSDHQETREEGTRQGARLPPQARPPPSWALHCYTGVLLPPIYIHVPPNIQEHHKNLIPPPQPSVLERSHLGAFSRAPSEGALITEGLYINSMASPVMCEQFTSDLWVHSYQLDDFFSLSLWISIQSSPRFSWRSIRCNLLLRCVCRDPMNCGFMIQIIFEQYLILL